MTPSIRPRLEPFRLSALGLLLVQVVLVLTMGSTDGRKLSRGLPSVYRTGGPSTDDASTDDASTDDVSTVRQVTADGSSAMPTCPGINLTETSLMVGLNRIPGGWTYGVQFKTSCTDSNGKAYDPVYTSLGEAAVVVYRRQQFLRVWPNEIVGALSCGMTIQCAHSLVYSSASLGRSTELRLSSGESCDYDYRNFIQWGYKERGLGYTCSEDGRVLLIRSPTRSLAHDVLLRLFVRQG